MFYIIDGNNLAGKLGIINQDNFNQIVIEYIKNSHIANKDVVLVFDSNEIMGDKIKNGKFTIVYSPRDSRYKDADDRIVELLEEYAQNKDRRPITLITEDIEIIEIAKIITKKYKCKIVSVKSKDFISNIETGKSDEDTELDEEEIDMITKEMMKKWI